jgi:glutathione S-transferase
MSRIVNENLNISFVRLGLLAACALFAPMYQPSGYGLKWPEMSEIPVEMTEWVASHDDALHSLAIRYEQNR